ncbi:hypothetical protein [Clostridium folliculivorans]|uniref:EF-hand domain-containing protein n=1 Tax=Clostridium folliculivorans TaxID=2886038 RepID=A0A9W6DAH9_9CLOT|nr:hypothetical protein [Clostridium folliculivorans]GKU24991.1 hypothetical protein CFOLD11_18170 [Clostridium folliculivorans]GKU31089.1 hypothetical protein CFB3_31960 [Clostridium folliculivorans]
MYTKNLLAYSYNSKTDVKLQKKINLMKVLILLLLLTICGVFIRGLTKSFEYRNKSNLLVADFKNDITMLSEAANVIETERTYNKFLEVGQFGTDGKLIDAKEISKDLSLSLINITDMNKNNKIDSEEISELGIMRFRTDIYQKELKTLQFSLKSPDHNLKNFIIITKGKYAGTILYNGNFKFIDNENKRYFGLEIYI